MIKGWKVRMDRGHYKGRPGIIIAVNGGECTVVLTDTPNYPKYYDVTIEHVKQRDFHRL